MPTTDAYGQSIQVASITDAPNAQVLAQALSAMVAQVNLTFTNAAARNAAITSPVAGMRAWLATEKLWTYYDGTAWRLENLSAFLYAAATQSLTHNTSTLINIANASVDDTAGLNAGGKYWTVPVTGKYRLVSMVSWDSNATGWRTHWLTAADVIIPGSQAGAQGVGVGATVERSCIGLLTAGQQIKLIATQQSGGALSTAVTGGVAASIEITFLHT